MRSVQKGLAFPQQKLTSTAMDIYEAGEHRFIIRIYLEETLEEAGFATWRGQICHVGDGRKERVQDLDDIVGFIVPYLEEMGARLSLSWRLKRWLNRWQRDRAQQG
jgi:hypothetical protein